MKNTISAAAIALMTAWPDSGTALELKNRPVCKDATTAHALSVLWLANPDATRGLLLTEEHTKNKSFPGCQLVEKLEASLFGTPNIRVNFSGPDTSIVPATWSIDDVMHFGFTFVLLHNFSITI